jgi:hypothetical protein
MIGKLLLCTSVVAGSTMEIIRRGLLVVADQQIGEFIAVEQEKPHSWILGGWGEDAETVREFIARLKNLRKQRTLRKARFIERQISVWENHLVQLEESAKAAAAAPDVPVGNKPVDAFFI